MTDGYSDAFVFFGATGDLAHKKIFPALQAMAKRGHLDVPIIGVAKAGWTLDQLRARARDSVEKHGGLDPAAFPKLNGLLRYVDGDYRDTATFQALREQLGAARRPAYYLAIPPTLFPLVVDQLRQSGCTRGARVIVEKPFGRDRDSAQSLNRTLFGRQIRVQGQFRHPNKPVHRRTKFVAGVLQKHRLGAVCRFGRLSRPA